VNLQELLSKLASIGVAIREIDLGAQKLCLLTCKLPEFPFGGREHAWYPLILKNGQDTVDREEVEAILRHLWHSEQEFFPEDEGGPIQ
jgi:hypothetical protein